MDWKKLNLYLGCLMLAAMVAANGCVFDSSGIAPPEHHNDAAVSPDSEVNNNNSFDSSVLPDREVIQPDAHPGIDAGGDACVPTNGGIEICDGIDNNCNGQIDEGFDLQTDPNNCGYCGNICNLPNATSQCIAGQCRILECAKSGNSHTWWDLNNNPADGCEYQCQVTMGGHEVCDGLDNDCDGQIDEDCGSLKLLFQFGDSWTTWPVFVADLSGNGNNGAAYGGASLACNAGDFVPGEDQDSCSAAFDGTGYIEVPDDNTLDFGNGSFTFMAWVKTSMVGTSTVFKKENPGYVNLRATKPNGYESTWETRDSNNNYLGARGSKTINDNIWHLLVAVRDNHNNTLKLFIDGVKDIEVADNRDGLFTFSSNLRIGLTLSGNEGYLGKIDEFAVYDRALSDIEIMNYYNLFIP